MTQQIMNAIQSIIQTMPEFEGANVVINDWRPLDNSFAVTMPLVLINQSGLIEGLYDAPDCPIRQWQVPFFIIKPLEDWYITMEEIGALREAVLNFFDDNDNRNLGITDHYVSLNRIADINPSEPVIAYDDPYTTAEMKAETTPMLLDCGMVFTIEERF